MGSIILSNRWIRYDRAPLNRIAPSSSTQHTQLTNPTTKRRENPFPHYSFLLSMASLQHTTASLNSKHIPTIRNTLSPKPILNLLTSLTLKSTRPRPRRSLKVRMSATAATSYATAFADLVTANNTLEATTTDVEKLEELFSDPIVLDYFSSPIVDDATKAKTIEEIATSSGLQPHTQNFLNILVETKRIDIIIDIIKEFELVCNSLSNTELVIVTSVVKLESQHLAQIAKQVQKITGAKNVRIKTLLDPSLVAGFTVRYGDSGSKLIDMSVKKKLEEIAAQLELGDIQLAA